MKYRVISFLVLAALIVGMFGMPSVAEAASYQPRS